MAEKENNDEILDKLKDVEHQLENLKKEACIDVEDQLFFGVIISLLILFVTLPVADLVLFLQGTFALAEADASRAADTIKHLGILTFLVSAFSRYCAVISNQNSSKKYRLLSIEMLILAFNAIVLVITVNLIPLFALYIGPFGLSWALFILMIFYIIMISIEKRILKIYANKGFIFKKDTSFPYASVVMLIVLIAVCVAVLEEVFAMMLGFGFDTFRFLVAYSIAAIVTILFVFMRKKIIKPNKKRRKTELTDY